MSLTQLSTRWQNLSNKKDCQLWKQCGRRWPPAEAAANYAILCKYATFASHAQHFVGPLTEFASAHPESGDMWDAITDETKSEVVFPFITETHRCNRLVARAEGASPLRVAKAIYACTFNLSTDFVTFDRLSKDRECMLLYVNDISVSDETILAAAAKLPEEEDAEEESRLDQAIAELAEFGGAVYTVPAAEPPAADRLAEVEAARNALEERLAASEAAAAVRLAEVEAARNDLEERLAASQAAAAVRLAEVEAAQTALEERLAASEATAADRLAEMEAAYNAAEERARLAEEGRVRAAAEEVERSQRASVLLHQLADTFGAQPAVYAAPPPAPEPLFISPEVIQAASRYPSLYARVTQDAMSCGGDPFAWVTYLTAEISSGASYVQTPSGLSVAL